jgi:hypothetical protein
MTSTVTLAELKAAITKTIQLQKAMIRASSGRSSLPSGSSRARVTTANARHANACEAYDKQRDHLIALMQRAINSLDYHK